MGWNLLLNGSAETRARSCFVYGNRKAFICQLIPFAAAVMLDAIRPTDGSRFVLLCRLVRLFVVASFGSQGGLRECFGIIKM